MGTAFAATGPGAWLCSPLSITLLSLLFALFCTFLLGRSAKARGNWLNVLNVLVFAVLIAGGIWVWWRDRPDFVARLTPVLPFGPGGLFQAMGYTFIALQGFIIPELIFQNLQLEAEIS